ncbi:nuclear transport factor 2 family protein [Methylomonas sp. MgM2]
MTLPNALPTVQQFQQWLAAGDSRWTGFVADDISFTGPAAGLVRGKDNFIALNNDFFPRVRGYEPVSAFGQGDLALLEGVLTVAAPSGREIRFGLAEIYQVKNGKIQNIRIYYDAEEFRAEFGQCR